MRAALATGLALALLGAGLALALGLRGGRHEPQPSARTEAEARLETSEPAASLAAGAPVAPELEAEARVAPLHAASTEPRLGRAAPVEVPTAMSAALADGGPGSGALAGRIVHDLPRLPSNVKLSAEVDFGALSMFFSLSQDGCLQVHGELTPAVSAALERALAAAITTTPRDDGTFLFPSLRADPLEPYLITVRLDGTDMPLHFFPRITVAPRSVTEPPELNPVDLRGMLTEARVRVTDLAGAPLAAKVWFRGSGEPESAWREIQHHPGRPLTLAAAASGFDLRAVAPGLRMETREGVAGDVSLALSPGFSVVLRLRQRPALPAGVTLAVMLQAVDMATAVPVPRQQWFDPSGSCAFIAPCAAAYRALLMFNLDAVGGGFHLLSQQPCATLQVPDENGATVTLDVSQAEVDATYRRLLDELEQELKRPVELKGG